MKVKDYWFLRMGADCLEDALRFNTKTAAVCEFQQAAEELALYGQQLEASLHSAPGRDTLNEYPEFVLALGPRGGVQVQPC